MIPGIETALREALVEGSESVMPRADLADLVRRATRRRRRTQASVISAGLVAVTVCCLIAVSALRPSPYRRSSDHRSEPPGRVQIAATFGSPDAMAASSRLIYVAEGDHPSAVLAAYDRITGRLVRHISVPALPSAVRIGPSGLVWLAFYPDSNGGGTGVWLLSPDLTRRSGVDLGASRYFGAAPFDVLPTGVDSAVLVTDHGLALLRLPSPGQPGASTLRWGPPVPSARRIHGLPVQAVAFAGRVAIRVGSDDGHSLISFAGHHSPTFSPRPPDSLGAMAVGTSGLWVTVHADNGGVNLGLVLLDDRLRPVTPPSVRANRLLADATDVEAIGHTVWVILGRSPWLACFTDSGGQVGPVATLGAFPAADAGYRLLAAVGHTLYLLEAGGVGSYRIPATCR